MCQKPLSLHESQQAALEVLIKFDEICRKNGFRYFLAYGTLIGAIRHNGFIPWDDDIDVAMPRDDFDAFICYMKEHQSSLYPFKLHTRANTKNYYYGIPRLSDMSYKYVNTEEWGEQFDLGVFVDIYPWDNYCSTNESAKKLMQDILKMNKRYIFYLFSHSMKDSSIKTILRKTIHYFTVLIKGKDYAQRIDDEIRAYILSNTTSDDKYLGLVSWAERVVLYEKNEMMNMQAVLHEFEGHMFYIPAAYDYVLKTSYGDYMKLPPEEERVPYHNYYIYKREL